MESLEQQAARLCKAKQWEQALSLYTKIINISTSSPNLAAHDRRAMCYEALGRLPEALDDAKRMLQLDKHNIKGYLRVGKIYQLQDKDESALRYYARGMANTSDSDPLRKVLLQMKKTVEERLHGKRSGLDPFTALPPELLWQIFSWCTLSDRVRACRVSKAWRRAIIRTPYFWQILDFSTLRKQPSTKSLDTCVTRARATLKALLVDVSISRLIHQRLLGPHLTTLRCPFPTDAMPGLRMMKQLESLFFSIDRQSSQKPGTFLNIAGVASALPNLQSLSAPVSSSSEVESFNALQCRQLLHLHLDFRSRRQRLDTAIFTRGDHTLSMMPKLQILRLTGECAIMGHTGDIGVWPNTVTTLDFDGFIAGQDDLPLEPIVRAALPNALAHYTWNVRESFPRALDGGFPALKSLHCRVIRSIIQPPNMPILSQDPCWEAFGETLQELGLTDSRADSEDLIQILSHLPRIQVLTLRNARLMDDDVLQYLSKEAGQLVKLDLGGCNRIGSAAVLTLAKCHPGLAELTVTKNLLAVDVLGWLRKTRKIKVNEVP